jgi:hypothetical protein
MKNMDGEDIPDEKVEEIEERVSELSKENIDELFHRIGFKVVKSKEGLDKPRKYKRLDNKALTPHQLEQIKSGDSAIVETMLFETPLDAVLTNLEELERRK